MTFREQKKTLLIWGKTDWWFFLDFQNTFEIWPEQFHKRPVVGWIEACHGLHLVPRMRFGDLLTRPLFRQKSSSGQDTSPSVLALSEQERIIKRASKHLQQHHHRYSTGVCGSMVWLKTWNASEPKRLKNKISSIFATLNTDCTTM